MPGRLSRNRQSRASGFPFQKFGAYAFEVVCDGVPPTQRRFNVTQDTSLGQAPPDLGPTNN
ncbi:MAG: hypothetical protein JKY65_32815 [Planctomycetes bacterium]|nr:hypothetical protein [Planctomycetota bacterium]